MSIYEELSQAVQSGKTKVIPELVTKALEEGNAPKDILNNGLLAGMSVVGEKFKAGEVYVPTVLIAARAMNNGIEVLKPAMSDGDSESKGKVILGTVKGDLHDIGKNLVKIMMEGKGIEVIDLGVDVAPEKYVEAALQENAKLIACSALLTTTMNALKDVVQTVEDKGVHGEIKIMAGGAPVTQDFCNEIGVDYYTDDATSASDLAVEILAAN